MRARISPCLTVDPMSTWMDSTRPGTFALRTARSCAANAPLAATVSSTGSSCTFVTRTFFVSNCGRAVVLSAFLLQAAKKRQATAVHNAAIVLTLDSIELMGQQITLPRAIRRTFSTVVSNNDKKVGKMRLLKQCQGMGKKGKKLLLAGNNPVQAVNARL